MIQCARGPNVSSTFWVKGPLREQRAPITGAIHIVSRFGALENKLLSGATVGTFEMGNFIK